MGWLAPTHFAAIIDTGDVRIRVCTYTSYVSSDEGFCGPWALVLATVSRGCVYSGICYFVESQIINTHGFPAPRLSHPKAILPPRLSKDLPTPMLVPPQGYLTLTLTHLNLRISISTALLSTPYGYPHPTAIIVHSPLVLSPQCSYPTPLRAPSYLILTLTLTRGCLSHHNALHIPSLSPPQTYPHSKAIPTPVFSPSQCYHQCYRFRKLQKHGKVMAYIKSVQPA